MNTVPETIENWTVKCQILMLHGLLNLAYQVTLVEPLYGIALTSSNRRSRMKTRLNFNHDRRLKVYSIPFSNVSGDSIATFIGDEIMTYCFCKSIVNMSI